MKTLKDRPILKKKQKMDKETRDKVIPFFINRKITLFKSKIIGLRFLMYSQSGISYLARKNIIYKK